MATIPRSAVPRTHLQPCSTKKRSRRPRRLTFPELESII
jgi:hypothetical protein